MSKKYFWLKLKDDFFTTREVKKLRRIAGGDTYTIIYLKLQLLSIKKEGLLEFEGTEESLIEQLALELDEKEDNVGVTLTFLEQNKLIEQLTQDEFLLNKVPESIGSETGAAERMRNMREKAKKQNALEGNKRNNVTGLLQPVTKSYTEIEIELEKELELEKDIVRNEELFSEFWELYPNKKAKKPAKTKYLNDITKVKHNKIMKHLSIMVKHKDWTKQKGKYIPLPSTYLNQERYNDVLENNTTHESVNSIDQTKYEI